MNLQAVFISVILLSLSIIKPKYNILYLVIGIVSALPIYMYGGTVAGAVFPSDILLVFILIRSLRFTKNYLSTEVLHMTLSLTAMIGLITMVWHMNYYNDWLEVIFRITADIFRILCLLLIPYLIFSENLKLSDLKDNLKLTNSALILFAIAGLSYVFQFFDLGIFALDQFNLYESLLVDPATLGLLNRASVGTIAQIGIGLIFYMYVKKIVGTKILVFSVILFISLILVSLSRTNLLATLFFLVVCIFTLKGYYVPKFFSVLLILLGLFVYLNIEEFSVLGRFATLSNLEEDNSLNTRFEGWVSSVTFLVNNLEHLLLGVGYSNFSLYLKGITGLSAGHNVFLSILAELGIIVGLLYVRFYYKIFKLYFNNVGNLRSQKIVWISFISSLLIAGGTVEVLYPSPTMYMSFALINTVLSLIIKTQLSSQFNPEKL